MVSSFLMRYLTLRPMRCMGVVRDKTVIAMTEENGEDTTKLSWEIRCGDPHREEPKDEVRCNHGSMCHCCGVRVLCWQNTKLRFQQFVICSDSNAHV